MKNEFLNSTDISRILGVTPPTIIDLINEGRIESSQVTKRTRRIEPEDLIIYLENLGNDKRAMAKFRMNIYKFLYSKYSNIEYLKEANKQNALYDKLERERLLAK